MESRGKKPEFSITSIPSLNEKIWGIKRREMTIVGARTSQGKSLFMNQLAWDLADQGHKVLYLSLEMDVSSRTVKPTPGKSGYTFGNSLFGR